MNTTSIFFPLSGDPLLRMRHTKISKRSILTWGIFPSRGFEMAMREGNKGIQCPKGKYVFEDIGHETWDLRMSQCRVGTIGTVPMASGLRGEYWIFYVTWYIGTMDYALSVSPSSTGWRPWKQRSYSNASVPPKSTTILTYEVWKKGPCLGIKISCLESILNDFFH